MAEPTIIQAQREVIRSVRQLADQHVKEEAEAEGRLRLDQEATDQAFAQAREAADAELKRAFAMLQDADRLVQPRGDRLPLGEIAPVAPPTLFDTDLLIGMRIATGQIQARLDRIRASFEDTTSNGLVTSGIVLGAVVAAGAILLLPFATNLRLGGNGWNFGWFGAMLSPLLLALLIAGARATVLRPYSPNDDYQFIRESMAHVLYMHQVLVDEARATHDRRLNERRDRYAEAKEKIAQSFRQQLVLLEPTIAKFAAEAAAAAPEWGSSAWQTWVPSNRLPHATSVGELLAGIREDRLALPALLPFPHERSLLVKTDAQARERAIRAIQSMLLRLVATAPPGDLRFILIDPVGQGQNVAPFTPFADVGVGLHEGRAWTEPHQIEQRLRDLVNLIEGAAEAQTFQSMLPRFDDSRATGIAEPCRVLVVLDFPANFGSPTARMLTSIVQKGPSAGIHPLVLVDTDTSSPYKFNLLELEQASTVLAWDGRRFVWQDPDFRSCWIELDKPPAPSLAKKILRGARQSPTARSA